MLLIGLRSMVSRLNDIACAVHTDPRVIPTIITATPILIIRLLGPDMKSLHRLFEAIEVTQINDTEGAVWVLCWRAPPPSILLRLTPSVIPDHPPLDPRAH